MNMTVEWKAITKQYRSQTALRGVTATLSGNKIIGLLGRNGSGKTSLLSMMKGLLRPTSGSILVQGQTPYENSELARQICFVRDSRMAYGFAKTRDALAIAASAWPNWDADYASALADRFELPLDTKVQHLSRGMESALGAILGLASRAPLTLLDETYIGMDAHARYLFYEELLADYIRFPRMLILSTHLIEEVGKLFEEVVVIDRGTLLLHEPVEQLLMKAYSVTGTEYDVDRFTEDQLVLYTLGGGSLKSASVFGEMTDHLRKLADLYHLEVRSLPLQDLFVHLTSRQEVRA
ncbi:ABC transporter ATP-binding protein [Paenibacillus methanolicus]|uniref:ABC-2 type transport system ATP-binding protein n=1 Tax=Paenibacillus methanolicus TaxID=582686 RepID=A0A5S5BTH6_9BACL|nr:ABC transporter ATP-binding protein [Paenibacillus methanolicus]TYP70254.1 ABC-2 type transport system ATP-binding protein [Paenibacillus methanolicus]